MYVPRAVLCCTLTLSVDVLCPFGVRLTDELLSDDFGPVVEETDVEIVIVPANLLRLVNVTRVVADVPRVRPNEFGFTVIEKSETITRIETEWTSDPLVPVTVRV